MNEYSREEFHDCLGGRRVVFAGDSTVRQVYWAAAIRLDHEKARLAILELVAEGTRHMDQHFEVDDVRLEFIWDPWLNSSRLETELAKFKAQEARSGTAKPGKEDPAALVLLGSPGLWAARHGGDDFFDIFKRGVQGTMPYLQSKLDDTLISPTRDLGKNYASASNQIFLAPVQVPHYKFLSGARAETITQEKVDKMNDYLASLLGDEQSRILWSYNRMTQGEERAYEETGLHVVDGVAERKIDIVLNARCNSPAGRVFPHKETCCMRYPERNTLQAVALFAMVLCPLLGRLTEGSKAPLLKKLPSKNILTAVGCIAGAIFMCTIADRSHSFVKLDRHYRVGAFLSSCFAFALVSLLTRKRSTSSVARGSVHALVEGAGPRFRTFHEQQPLSRDQCDEWKGWMQALILIYHYNYASQTLGVYKIIRVVVSSYVYLSGYGHTLYLLETGDYSLSRLASVVFRLNLLSALLPYAMETDYKFYYFAPIITFWYLVIWLTLRIGRGCNHNPMRLLAKVLVAAVITSLIIITPHPLAGVSTLCRVAFRMSWDSREARFRLGLDRYVVFFGMMTASIVHRMSLIRDRQGLSGSSRPRPSSAQIRQFSLIDPLLEAIVFPDHTTRHLRLVICCWSAMITLIYGVAAHVALPDKAQFNTAHPYMSWIPIMSFMLLRNVHWRLRESHLALPAALGKFSLETYVLQYHLWLGSDATARLRVGLWDRFGGFAWLAGPGRLLETVAVTTVFLCLSIYVHNATQVLARWLFYGSPPPVAERPISSGGRDGHTSESPSNEGKKRPSQDGRPHAPALSGPHGCEEADSPGGEEGGGAHVGNIAGGPASGGGRGRAVGAVAVLFLMLWVGNLMSH